MKYHELATPPYRTTKRLGRGISGGKGKTAGRGTKGQGARTGSRQRPGFAGGQNPLMQALPKLPGFTSHWPKIATVHTGQLEQFPGKTIDSDSLAKAGLIEHPFMPVKLLLGKGALTKKVIVKLQAGSANAIAVVQKVGGSFETVPRLARPKTTTKKSTKSA